METGGTGAARSREGAAGPPPGAPDDDSWRRVAGSAGLMGIWELDLVQGTAQVDDQVMVMYGRTAEEFGGTLSAFTACIHPDDRPTAVAVTQAAARAGTALELTYRVVHPDGTVRHLLSRGRALPGGRLVGATVDLTDLELARRAEQAQLEHHLATLEALNRAAVEMNRLTRVDDVLRVCTEQAIAIVGARQGVSSITRGLDWSQAVASVVLADDYAAYRDYAEAPDGSGIYALVCESNQPLRMTQAELEAHPRWRGFGASAGVHPPMRGWLAAPLVAADGQNLGLIQLSDKIATGAPARVPLPRGAEPPADAEFTDGDLAVLVQLAQLASPALEKTLDLEREHEIAVELQRSLLPELPRLPGVELAARYVPGTDDMLVGGDWYDVFELRPGWVGLAVGDAVGHGLRSASLMGQVRSALRAYALLEEDPAAVVAHLDRFVAGLGDERVATLAFVAWQPASGIARVVLAGHPAPTLRAADGTVSTLDADPGLPLGALPDAGVGYTSSLHRVPPGATVVLFSDGLVETRSRPIGVGLERLAAALRLVPPQAGLACDVLLGELTGGRNLDDVALLAARAEDVAAVPALGGTTARAWAWRHLPPEPGRVPVLRAAVRSTLAGWGVTADADVAELVVSELASNAVRHARAPYDLELRWDGHTLAGRLVHGGDRPHAAAAPPGAADAEHPAGLDELGESGRGLLLVAALTSAWGTDPTPPGGTSTWFHLQGPRAAGPGTAP